MKKLINFILKSMGVLFVLFIIVGVIAVNNGNNDTKNEPSKTEAVVINVSPVPDVPSQTVVYKEATQNSPPVEQKANEQRPLPEDQIEFISIVESARDAYRATDNQLKHSLAREERKSRIMEKRWGGRVSGWVGTIDKLSTNGEGKAVLVVRISPYIVLKTMNNAFSDAGEDTLIDINSDLFKKLVDLKEGQRVLFDGDFRSSETDHFKEISLTIGGSLDEPEYIFRFSTVKPLTD